MTRKNIIHTAWLSALTVCISCAPHKPTKNESGFQPHPQSVTKQHVETLVVGSAAPDFHLPGIDEKFYSLNDFETYRTLVIVFTCNHCPTAQAYEDRIIQLVNDYKDKSVGIISIMPNSTLAVLPEECGYTDLNDSYEEMKIRASYKHFNFPYLYDGDTQSTALRYGPVATPHAFVFDAKRTLRYSGRLDASEEPGSAHAEDLRAAIDALQNGTPVKVAVNKVFGCSIKWGWKDEWNQKVEQTWNEKPVKLEKVTPQQIKELASNPSDKLRLINVWATWCAPCVAEYPSLVLLQRMYGQRKFEFVSLSGDKPEHEKETLEFLQEKHSAIPNYLYDGKDNYALIDALDPEWNGALPYTLLIEPGGKIVYRSSGAVDYLELKRAIVENHLVGRYY